MRGMLNSAKSFNKDLCLWREKFPYTKAGDIFTASGCTYKDTPQEDQGGPFCASNCASCVSKPDGSVANGEPCCETNECESATLGGE